VLLLRNKDQLEQSAPKFHNLPLCRQRSGHERTAISSLHDTRTV